MKHYPLSEAMSAFVSKSAEFVASDASLPSRRHAFLQACRHFTPQAPAGWLIEKIPGPTGKREITRARKAG